MDSFLICITNILSSELPFSFKKKWCFLKKIFICIVKLTSFLKTFIMFYFKKLHLWGFPGGSVVKNLSAMQETPKTPLLSLGQEDVLMQKCIVNSPKFSSSQVSFLSLQLPNWNQLKGGPQEGTSPAALWTLKLQARHPGHTQGNNGKEMRSNQVGCKELPVHIQRATENLQLCPSGIHPERHRRSVFNPLAHSCTHGEIRLELWHNF